MDTEMTAAESRYFYEQKMLNEESILILEANARREKMLSEGFCDDCASGYNLFVGCYECRVHSGKRICQHPDCHGGYCITEYDL